MRRDVLQPTRVIISGEYPPQPGGVSDFTRLLAARLAREGERVYVVAPVASGPDPVDLGVSILRVPDLGPRSLDRIRIEIEELPSPRRLLVQYAPHSFGWRGMNIAFGRWLGTLQDPVDVLFHEVSFPSDPRQPLRHALLARVQRAMAKAAVRAADTIFVSSEAWTPLVRALGATRDPIPLPIPSNLPDEVDPAAVESVRTALASGGASIVGHFGTFGREIAALLGPALRRLVGDTKNRRALLVGRGSDSFAADLVRAAPELAGRVQATGEIEPHRAATCLAASDLLLQPYPDGVTTRRTSLMAGLALGRAVVTNKGVLSEPLWADSDAVALAERPDHELLVAVAERLLGDEHARRAVGQRARSFYETALSWNAVVRSLRAS